MADRSKILITVPESPYMILQLSFDADEREIQSAFRSFVRRRSRALGASGKSAHKKLIDPKERIKADAFCCQLDLPQVDLSDLRDHVTSGSCELYCHVLHEPAALADLSVKPGLPADELQPELDFGEIPYRPDYLLRSPTDGPAAGVPPDQKH